jgi:hypothetical protein
VETYGKIAMFFALSFLIVPNSFAQQYVINTYDGDTTPMPVKTAFVDLDTKAVLSEIAFNQEGWILNKKALSIAGDSDTRLVSAVMAGCYCDNSIAGKPYLKIGVFDPSSRNLIFSYADSNISIHTFEGIPDRRVYLEGEIGREPRHTINGDYTLGRDFSLVLRNRRPDNYSYDLYPGLGPFINLQPIASATNIYRANHNYESFVVKTNPERSMIADTLKLISNGILIDSVLSDSISDRSHILAVIDTLVYDFNLNYEFYGETITKTRDLGRIDSHVRLYRLSDFTPLDSIPVADYPPGDYPDGTFDVADVVGPYIVYYFFGREGLTRYAPAMLFIFDTRTNEATWLRVGWR